MSRFVPYQARNATDYESRKKHERMVQKMKEAEKYHVGGVLKTDKGTIIYNVNGVKKAKI